MEDLIAAILSNNLVKNEVRLYNDRKSRFLRTIIFCAAVDIYGNRSNVPANIDAIIDDCIDRIFIAKTTAENSLKIGVA